MEYFIHAYSNAAPFVSDEIIRYIQASSPKEAITKFVDSNPHPMGVYSAACYNSADDYHKNLKPQTKWLSGEALKKLKSGAFVE
jgi:hypothetical protein